jgi:hypothetical protein
MSILLRRRSPANQSLVPAVSEPLRYALSQAGRDEKASLPYPCDKGCGAPAWQLCYSPTGLPASAPCHERARAVVPREATPAMSLDELAALPAHCELEGR